MLVSPAMLRLRLAESPACMRSSATGNNACQLQSRIQGRHCRLRAAQSGRIPASGRAPNVGHGRAWRAPRCVEPALSTENIFHRIFRLSWRSSLQHVAAAWLAHGPWWTHCPSSACGVCKPAQCILGQLCKGTRRTSNPSITARVKSSGSLR